jgi:hypothetical protein
MRSRALKVGLGAAGLLVATIGLGAWTLLRVEDIPEQLEPIELDPDELVIPGLAEQPPLKLAEQRGKTVFFVVVGAHSGESREGEALNRALNRWTYPDTTVGYIIGDAEGFGVFRSKIAKIMGHFGAEMRYPLYVDFEGVFIETFKLPKGHHGFVVVGPDGKVLERRSGGIETDGLDAVRELLSASEPPPGPEAPDFTLGPLSDEHCADRVCVLAFLGRSVARGDVPGIEDGFEGDGDARFDRMRDPSIRIARTLLPTQLTDADGVLVGTTTDLEYETWTRLDEAPDARTAFELAEDEAAIIVIEHGRVAFRESGLIPLYQWGTIADVTGIDINDRKPPKGSRQKSD